MMERLSDKEHAVKQIDEDGCMVGISGKWYEEAKEKLARYEDLEEQGILVYVVRCKDCRHAEPSGRYGRIFWCNEYRTLVTESNFCKLGVLEEKNG